MKKVKSVCPCCGNENAVFGHGTYVMCVKCYWIYRYEDASIQQDK